LLAIVAGSVWAARRILVAPPPGLAAWRWSLHSAIGRLESDDPAAAQALRRRLATAEALSAPAWWERLWVTPEVITDAWRPAFVEAVDALRSMQIERQEAADWRQLRDALRRRLAVQQERLGEASSGSADARAASRAAARLAWADSLAKQSRFGAAIGEAREAIGWLDRASGQRQQMLSRFTDPARLQGWRRQVDAAIAASHRARNAVVIVDKWHRKLEIYTAGRRVASVQAELGTNGLLQKLYAGDAATPEGRYHVAQKKDGAATRYHKALLLDYPNAEDRRRFARARRSGALPRGVGIGGLIEIHGGGGSGRDWTDGCVALSNADMDRVYAQVAVGTPVVIVGALPEVE